MKLLRSLCHLLLLPLLVPLALAATLLRVRTGRLRTARANGDLGALSIEMALIAMVVVGIAFAVLAALTSLGSSVKTVVPTSVPVGVHS